MSETALATGNVTIKIADLDVTLPLKFAAGMVLSDHDAKVLDAAYQRQFTNNQNANAKNRAGATPPKAPLSADEIAALYTEYKPAVGDTTRTSTMEKLRLEASWSAWVGMVTEHNAAVASNSAPVITKAVKDGKAYAVSLPSKPIKDAAGKVSITVQEQRDNISNAMLAKAEYADRIQIELDRILAERGTKKVADSTVEVTASADLI